MPKKQGDIPPSWQRRKDGEDVAVWVPREVRDRVQELHDARGDSRSHWTIRDTWIAVVGKATQVWPWRARRERAR